jgi:hypothetical protein
LGPLLALRTPQPFDQLLQLHILVQPVEAGELDKAVGFVPAARAPDIQPGTGLVPDRIDWLWSGVVGHVRMMFSCR